MKEMVHTLAAWRVQEGRHQAFISAWKDLGAAFNSLSDPPGKGVLIQSTSDPTLFYSFVPWKSMEAVEAMRNDHHCQGGNQKARGTMHGGHPGVVSRRRRIALAERTDKRIPTR
jgi:heme-degrading monooxygenase HmoA